jgi:hypothetical protein
VSEPIRATVAVDALLDELAIIHLDFHPTCSARVSHAFGFGRFAVWLPWSKPCGQAATGVVTCRWCGSCTSTCEAHYDFATKDALIVCGSCGTGGPGPRVFRFTPWSA